MSNSVLFLNRKIKTGIFEYNSKAFIAFLRRLYKSHRLLSILLGYFGLLWAQHDNSMVADNLLGHGTPGLIQFHKRNGRKNMRWKAIFGDQLDVCSSLFDCWPDSWTGYNFDK